jgi:hypothetical protein
MPVVFRRSAAAAVPSLYSAERAGSPSEALSGKPTLNDPCSRAPISRPRGAGARFRPGSERATPRSEVLPCSSRQRFVRKHCPLALFSERPTRRHRSQGISAIPARPLRVRHESNLPQRVRVQQKIESVKRSVAAGRWCIPPNGAYTCGAIDQRTRGESPVAEERHNGGLCDVDL